MSDAFLSNKMVVLRDLQHYYEKYSLTKKKSIQHFTLNCILSLKCMVCHIYDTYIDLY